MDENDNENFKENNNYEGKNETNADHKCGDDDDKFGKRKIGEDQQDERDEEELLENIVSTNLDMKEKVNTKEIDRKDKDYWTIDEFVKSTIHERDKGEDCTKDGNEQICTKNEEDQNE